MPIEACSRYKEHAFKKDACRICLRPKSQHKTQDAVTSATNGNRSDSVKVSTLKVSSSKESLAKTKKSEPRIALDSTVRGGRGWTKKNGEDNMTGLKSKPLIASKPSPDKPSVIGSTEDSKKKISSTRSQVSKTQAPVKSVLSVINSVAKSSTATTSTITTNRVALSSNRATRSLFTDASQKKARERVKSPPRPAAPPPEAPIPVFRKVDSPSDTTSAPATNSRDSNPLKSTDNSKLALVGVSLSQTSDGSHYYHKYDVGIKGKSDTKGGATKPDTKDGATKPLSAAESHKNMLLEKLRKKIVAGENISDMSSESIALPYTVVDVSKFPPKTQSVANVSAPRLPNTPAPSATSTSSNNVGKTGDCAGRGLSSSSHAASTAMQRQADVSSKYSKPEKGKPAASEALVGSRLTVVTTSTVPVTSKEGHMPSTSSVPPNLPVLLHKEAAALKAATPSTACLRKVPIMIPSQESSVKDAYEPVNVAGSNFSFADEETTSPKTDSNDNQSMSVGAKTAYDAKKAFLAGAEVKLGTNSDSASIAAAACEISMGDKPSAIDPPVSDVKSSNAAREKTQEKQKKTGKGFFKKLLRIGNKSTGSENVDMEQDSLSPSKSEENLENEVPMSSDVKAGNDAADGAHVSCDTIGPEDLHESSECIDKDNKTVGPSSAGERKYFTPFSTSVRTEKRPPSPLKTAVASREDKVHVSAPILLDKAPSHVTSATLTSSKCDGLATKIQQANLRVDTTPPVSSTRTRARTPTPKKPGVPPPAAPALSTSPLPATASPQSTSSLPPTASPQSMSPLRLPPRQRSTPPPGHTSTPPGHTSTPPRLTSTPPRPIGTPHMTPPCQPKEGTPKALRNPASNDNSFLSSDFKSEILGLLQEFSATNLPLLEDQFASDTGSGKEDDACQSSPSLGGGSEESSSEDATRRKGNKVMRSESRNSKLLRSKMGAPPPPPPADAPKRHSASDLVDHALVPSMTTSLQSTNSSTAFRTSTLHSKPTASRSSLRSPDKGSSLPRDLALQKPFTPPSQVERSKSSSREVISSSEEPDHKSMTSMEAKPANSYDIGRLLENRSSSKFINRALPLPPENLSDGTVSESENFYEFVPSDGGKYSSAGTPLSEGKTCYEDIDMGDIYDDPSDLTTTPPNSNSIPRSHIDSLQVSDPLSPGGYLEPVKAAMDYELCKSFGVDSKDSHFPDIIPTSSLRNGSSSTLPSQCQIPSTLRSQLSEPALISSRMSQDYFMPYVNMEMAMEPGCPARNFTEGLTKMAAINSQTMHIIIEEAFTSYLCMEAKFQEDLHWNDFTLSPGGMAFSVGEFGFYKAKTSKLAQGKQCYLMISVNSLPRRLLDVCYINVVNPCAMFSDKIPKDLFPKVPGKASQRRAAFGMEETTIAVLPYLKITGLRDYLRQTHVKAYGTAILEYDRTVCYLMTQILNGLLYLYEQQLSLTQLTADDVLMVTSEHGELYPLLNPAAVTSHVINQESHLFDSIVDMLFLLLKIRKKPWESVSGAIPPRSSYSSAFQTLVAMLHQKQFTHQSLVTARNLMEMMLWGPDEKEMTTLAANKSHQDGYSMWLEVSRCQLINEVALSRAPVSLEQAHQMQFLCSMTGKTLVDVVKILKE